MEALKDFLTDAALDHGKLMAFLTDPQSAIRAAQLSAEDERALQTGNPEKIYARLQGAEDRNSSSAYGMANPIWIFSPALSGAETG